MKVGVVGAGMGGLAAAVSLAARGCEVTVWEAADRPGGKVGVARADGATFDTGPSVLTLPRVLRELFDAVGARPGRYLEFVQPSPWFRYHFADGVELEFAHDPETTLGNVESALGPAARDELEDFLRYARDIWEAAAPNFIFAPAPTIGRVFGLGLSAPRELWQIDPLSSMWSGICERVDDPRLRCILARYATYVGADPRRAPATLNCIPWLELGVGGWGVEGGMYQLVRALVEVARDLGAEFRFGSRVEQIDCRGGCVREAVAGGRSQPVDAVVVNGEIGALDGLVDNHDVGSLEPDSTRSMSGWTAVWRSTAPTGGRPAHTVLFPESYAAEFDAIFGRGEIPSDPTIYACDQSLAHGRSGWSGASPLFAMVNAPAVDSSGGSALAEAADVRAEAADRLAGAGLIEEDDPVVWERTPIDLAERFTASEGAIYGPAPNSRLSAFRRPPNRVEGVDGLYVAGGGAHPGAGVPLCLQSGRLAAGAVVDDAGLWVDSD